MQSVVILLPSMQFNVIAANAKDRNDIIKLHIRCNVRCSCPKCLRVNNYNRG